MNLVNGWLSEHFGSRRRAGCRAVRFGAALFLENLAFIRSVLRFLCVLGAHTQCFDDRRMPINALRLRIARANASWLEVTIEVTARHGGPALELEIAEDALLRPPVLDLGRILVDGRPLELSFVRELINRSVVPCRSEQRRASDLSHESEPRRNLRAAAPRGDRCSLAIVGESPGGDGPHTLVTNVSYYVMPRHA